MRTNLHATSGALALALIVSAAAWASAGTVAGASLGEERAASAGGATARPCGAQENSCGPPPGKPDKGGTSPGR